MIKGSATTTGEPTQPHMRIHKGDGRLRLEASGVTFAAAAAYGGTQKLRMEPEHI
jgi:hypothetical protein